MEINRYKGFLELNAVNCKTYGNIRPLVGSVLTNIGPRCWHTKCRERFGMREFRLTIIFSVKSARPCRGLETILLSYRLAVHSLPCRGLLAPQLKTSSFMKIVGLSIPGRLTFRFHADHPKNVEVWTKFPM